MRESIADCLYRSLYRAYKSSVYTQTVKYVFEPIFEQDLFNTLTHASILRTNVLTSVQIYVKLSKKMSKKWKRAFAWLPLSPGSLNKISNHQKRLNHTLIAVKITATPNFRVISEFIWQGITSIDPVDMHHRNAPQYLAFTTVNAPLKHWGRDNMSDISPTTFWNAFSWMKIYEFRLKFHWSLFPRL